MNSLKFFMIFWSALLLDPRSAWSDDGVLPRGKAPAPARKLSIPETAVPSEAIDCTSYLGNPDAGDFIFAQDGRLVYFLSRQVGETRLEGKTSLYEVDLDNFRSKPLVSLRAGASASMLGHGQPIEAISVFDFRKMLAGCGEGWSAGIGIKWLGAQRIIKSYPPSSYKIVPSNQGSLLADMELRQIKTLDINNFQKRSLVAFGDKQLPLYLRLAPLQLFAFQVEQRELLRFDGLESEASAVLKLKIGMRLVQQDNLFGVASSREGGKILQINQLKGWSGDSFRALEIKLPEPFHADKVGLVTDFASGLTVVFGANSALRRELRQILLHTGKAGHADQVLQAPDGEYFSQVMLSPQSHKIVMLSRSLRDESVKSLRLGDPATGAWREIAIAKEGVVEKPANNSAEKRTNKSAQEKIEK